MSYYLKNKLVKIWREMHLHSLEPSKAMKKAVIKKIFLFDLAVNMLR